jgi:hypothetical protein
MVTITVNCAACGTPREFYYWEGSYIDLYGCTFSDKCVQCKGEIVAVLKPKGERG